VRLTLELALAQRWGVAGDDDKLGFAGSERLEGGLVAKGDCKYVPSVGLFSCAPERIFQPLPDFITSAKRELMLSAVFLVFLVGAIAALQR